MKSWKPVLASDPIQNKSMKDPKKSKPTSQMVVLLLLFILVLSATFQGCSSAANQPQTKTMKKSTQPMATNGFASTFVLPLSGNVYPQGYYSVSMNIGQPPKPYSLDIDSGSDLTWLQCDAPCISCTKQPHPLYKPNKNKLVYCNDPLCGFLHWPPQHQCTNPNDQCDYEVDYADHCSSIGVLIKDSFPLRFTNGSVVSPQLAFGCGYDQQFSPSHLPPPTDGVLGLGHGKSSIVSQLRDQGLTRNVVGHCLSGQGGFMFFGNDLIPSSGITWTPMPSNSKEKHYLTGPAELLSGKQTTGVKALLAIFDSGSSYTYFNSQAYQTILSLVRKDLVGKPLKDVKDPNLPVCWKGTKPFKGLGDVKNYFKPFALKFSNSKNVQLQLPPEAYLIVTKLGNVCLGVLNGTEAGLGNLNVIGDISLLDKMVIYDNEKQQIGWVPANCDKLPNMDRDYNEGFSRPYAANFGIFREHYAATYAYHEDL